MPVSTVILYNTEIEDLSWVWGAGGIGSAYSPVTLPTRPNVHLCHSALIIDNDSEALSGRARGLHIVSIIGEHC